MQEQMHHKIAGFYQTVKGYRAIFKALGIHPSALRAITNGEIVGRVVSHPRRQQLTKIPSRALA